MAGRKWAGAAGILAAGLALASGAQAAIYSCVDAKGRRITSDRVIPECIDREQKVHNSSGTAGGVVPPSLTGPELKAREEQARAQAEEQRRVAEEKRQQRALLIRYPTQAEHDSERAKALRSIDDQSQATQRHIVELQRDRKALDAEGEFYKSDRAKMPPKLKRQFEDNEAAVANAQRTIANQSQEKRRINARFDEELGRLRGLWAPQQATAPETAPVKR